MHEQVSQQVAQNADDDAAPGLAGAAGAGSARRLLLGAAGVFAVWLLLTGSLDYQELLVGLVVAIVVAAVSRPHLHLLDGIRLGPLLPWHGLRFLLSFLGALLRANVDMARRVLSPRLPVCPGMVEVRTRLHSPLGRLLLANAITLTPGTLSVDMVEDRIVVHWIDISPGTDVDRATHAIVDRFERHLTRLMQ